MDLIVIPEALWEPADKAYEDGRTAYIAFGQALAALANQGVTQQAIADRYDISQSAVGKAITVGSDERIIRNTNNLPKSTEALYLLTTLDDAGFNTLANPGTTQAKILEFKRPKVQAAPVERPAPVRPVVAPPVQPATMPAYEAHWINMFFQVGSILSNLWFNHYHTCDDPLGDDDCDCEDPGYFSDEFEEFCEKVEDDFPMLEDRDDIRLVIRMREKFHVYPKFRLIWVPEDWTSD